MVGIINYHTCFICMCRVFARAFGCWAVLNIKHDIVRLCGERILLSDADPKCFRVMGIRSLLSENYYYVQLCVHTLDDDGNIMMLQFAVRHALCNESHKSITFYERAGCMSCRGVHDILCWRSWVPSSEFCFGIVCLFGCGRNWCSVGRDPSSIHNIIRFPPNKGSETIASMTNRNNSLLLHDSNRFKVFSISCIISLECLACREQYAHYAICDDDNYCGACSRNYPECCVS